MLLLQVIRIIKAEKPDILNNFTLKPIIYGSIAALFAKVPRIINTFLGMGTIFISNNVLIKLLKVFICLLLRISYHCKNMLFIVQNNDDKKLLIELKIAKENDIVVQCSVGVKTEEFPKLQEPKGKIIFALVARMILDKGVNEFIIASKLLKEKGIVPTSMIDVSDGLASEILHLCKSSNLGCSVYEEKIPIDPMTYDAARMFNLDPTVCALSGGEDYELLFTVKQSDFDNIKNNPDISIIGHMTQQSEGPQLVSKSGNQHKITAQGWNAFNL